MTLDHQLRPRKVPVQARAHETRRRILDAAARVFAEHGYSAGTTNRIAAEAQMSVGSLYQYFPNKDAILVELSRDHVVASAASLSALLDLDPSERLEARLRRVVDAIVALHAGDPRLHQVLFEQAPRPEAFLRDLRGAEAQLTRQVAALLAADPEVDVPDLDLAARMTVTTVESLVHRMIARPHDDLDVDRFADELVRMLLGYLTTGRRSSERS